MTKNRSAGDDGAAPNPVNAEGVVKGSVQLVHAVGMHARPAVKLAKLAKRFQCQIAMRVAGGVGWVDAKSLTKIMATRAARDSIIEFEASGADAAAAVAALVTLIAQDFPDNGG
jgi:phosphocarrier protein HPr